MLKTDIIINKIALICWRKIKAFECFYSTNLSYLLASFWRINIGSNCRFFGIPTFVKAEGSSIRISKRCIFNSKRNSNLIGINHQCIIATHRNNAKLYIGENSGFSGTTIGCAEKIEIGQGVLCGANTVITDFDWHNTDPLLRHVPCISSKPIKIEDNVWIGINVIVLKGVTIGRNSVVAAGSIVTKNIPPNVIAIGQPAKPIKYVSKDYK